MQAIGASLFARWPATPAPLRAEALAVSATAHVLGYDLDAAQALAEAALADPDGTPIATVLGERALTLAAIGRDDAAAALEHARRGRAAAAAVPMPPFERELRGFEAALVDRGGDAGDGGRPRRRGHRRLAGGGRPVDGDLGAPGGRDDRHPRGSGGGGRPAARPRGAPGRRDRRRVVGRSSGAVARPARGAPPLRGRLARVTPAVAQRHRAVRPPGRPGGAHPHPLHRGRGRPGARP